MKKIILITIVFLTMVFMFKKVSAEELVIPDEAIRFRILANSNSPHDQYIKEKVKEKTQAQIAMLLKDSKTIDEAREKLKNNIKPLKDTIKEALAEEKEEINFDVDYGYHLFPSKEYKGITYNEGYYESLLVTLGKGEGDNWWCVLFPPLCLIEAEESTEVEYKFFVKELIDKFF